MTSTFTVAAGAGNTTEPSTSIDNAPTDPSHVDTATFEFSSLDSDGSFECRLDGGPWTFCSSPWVLSGLPEATHTLEARAISCNSIADSSPDSRTWEVVIPECDDGVTEGLDEECDDSNLVVDACTYGELSCVVCGPACTLVPGIPSSCGDGSTDAVNETCDDSNAVTEACACGRTSCQVCDDTYHLVAGATSYRGDGIGDACDEQPYSDIEITGGGCTCAAAATSPRGALLAALLVLGLALWRRRRA